ncbi:transcriptional regulator [Streptosporangium jomthongense]|uniref:GntR family transcriptional regulator n=1 Tax=Marinobacter aromaticivorans TaxID=1494078 RepID=A0ABW2J148_9GAMM|nr:GntR family transcriptional regulator [Marinobacter aromaticivorans]GGE81079.1 transcriptional regulator [Streptosporangium jomthongense]
MKPIASQPNLAKQVEEAILAEITSGRLGPGSRVVQEQIAKTLGVSRQPVQQALHILRSQGILRDAPGRGMEVVPLDLVYVRNMYDIRAVIEGLACREAAFRHPEKALRRGQNIIAKGKDAVNRGAYEEMIAQDMAFHNMIYELSDNPLIPATMDTHWTTAQRVMGEVLQSDEEPRDIWQQHEEILLAIAAGDAIKAEELARTHISRAANYMIERLRLNQLESEVHAS